MNAWEVLCDARELGMSIQVTYPDGDTAVFVLADTGYGDAFGHTGFEWVRTGTAPEGSCTAQSVVNAIRMCDPDVRLRETESVLTVDERGQIATAD